MPDIELIATTLLGVEALTARELKDLGFDNVKAEDGRVTFVGDISAICKSNIWLRTAERILVKLGEFNALTFDELFEKTKALPWEEWITEDASFPVKAYSLKSKLHSVPDCQAIVKKAVVERLKQCYEKDWFEESGPLYRIHLALFKDHAVLMIDTSGEGLHKRGYRQNSNEAPLKETLAAAMVMLSNWKPGKALIDPFCGSGTIPIEAALIGANIAPGIAREFVSETWSRIPRELWWNERKQAHSLIDNDIDFLIKGFDVDENAIKLSRENSSIAEVDKYITFRRLPVSDLHSNDKYGCIICNPPYGERMGDLKSIEKLYSQMGKLFGNLDTWSYFIIAPNENFEKLFGRKADKKRKLYNGMIKCYLHQYYGPRPPR